MCGICGIARPQTGPPIPKSLLQAMCQTLVHRGPDDEGLFLGTDVALGTRRLSIIDLEGGHQPLSNEEGTVWVAHNGEVYNFPDLRKDLGARGHLFKTRSDTETIVHAYEEWGEAFVERLRGMFAFALWDSRTRTLRLVRDRLGIKPLYYTLLEDRTLVFGSELKALIVHPGIKREVEPRALDLFLTLEYIPAPYSIFKNIFKLPAGCVLIYRDGNTQVKTYWDIEPETTSPVKPSKSRLESWMDELYALLKESVRLRLISDVPLGAFLSGGIDSSTIVGLMRELGAAPLKTFSIGFEEESYNELDYARRISQKFDTDHEEFIIRPNALELTEKLLHQLDEPFGDFSIFPTFMVSEMARKHVKVILSGDGGDELFGGYEHYQAQKLSRLKVLRPFHKSLPALTRNLPPSPKKKGFWNKLQRFGQGMDQAPDMRHFRWTTFLSRTVKESLYSADLIEALGGLEEVHWLEPLRSVFGRLERFDPINGELYLDLKTYLADDILVKVDRMSMAASLETRVPLLDHKVVEFMFGLPGTLKLRGWTTKWIFKKTMARLLPKENIYRPKQGFSIPIKHWLRGELRSLMNDYLNERRIGAQGYFHWAAVRPMIDRHVSGRANLSHQLWALLVFGLWHEQYLEKPQAMSSG